MDYLIYVITLFAIYTMVALSYQISIGYTGLLNFAQVGLLAIGAYSQAILTSHGIPFFLALALSAAITGAIGFLLALPSRRIKESYYALVTLGFMFVVNAVILNWTEVTGGPFGISGIARPAHFDTPQTFLFLVLMLTAAVSFFVYRVVHSPFGAALEAVRDDDRVAESLGKPTGKLRVIAMVLSAIVVGIAGALLAHFIQFISVQIFWLDSVVFVLSCVVVGGLASFWGAIAGTTLLYIFLEPLRFLPLPPGVLGPLRIIIYGSLLLLFVLFRPKGIMGRAQLDQ